MQILVIGFRVYVKSVKKSFASQWPWTFLYIEIPYAHGFWQVIETKSKMYRSFLLELMALNIFVYKKSLMQI
jgi:hypothetical protein